MKLMKKPVTGNKIKKSIRVSSEILETVESEYGSIQGYINDVLENQICLTRKDFLATWAMREAIYPMVEEMQRIKDEGVKTI